MSLALAFGYSVNSDVVNNNPIARIADVPLGRRLNDYSIKMNLAAAFFMDYSDGHSSSIWWTSRIRR
jgi:hypothetical protein